MGIVRRVGSEKVCRSVFTGCLTVALSFFAAITASAQTADGSGLLVYRQTFDAAAPTDTQAALPEWSPAVTTDVIPGRRLLGQYGNGTTMLTLENLPSHTAVTLEFSLYILNSWDGSAAAPAGPDAWQLAVEGGSPLGSTSWTFSNTSTGQSFGFGSPRSGALESSGAIFPFGYSVYRIKRTFLHSGSELRARFIGSPNEAIDNESWALDNVEVSLRSPSAALSWGYNGVGETGQGTASFAAAPGYVSNVSQFTALAAGNSHTIAIDASGAARVWTWGFNNVGQLGPIGGDRREPAAVSMPRRVMAVAAGGWHSLALLEDGTVWAWGYNSAGQLGDGTFNTRSVPLPVSGLSGVVAIAAGAYHSLALKSDGTIWGWGWGGRGQLGMSGGRPFAEQIQVPWRATAIAAGTGEGDFTIALASDGTVYAWGASNWCQTGICGGDVFQPRAVAGLPPAVAIGAGDYHAAAITADGRLFAWGSNLYGQLGGGTIGTSSAVPVEAGISGVIEVDGGARHTIVRTPSGVYVAGENRVLQHGAAGPDTTSWTLIPGTDAGTWGQVVAGGYHSYALRAFAPAIKAPLGIPIGTVPVNSEPRTIQFFVQNTGTDPVQFMTAPLVRNDSNNDGTFDSDNDVKAYSLRTDGCTGTVLEPGALCSMSLEFNPIVAGASVAARLQFSAVTSAPITTVFGIATFAAAVTDTDPPTIALISPAGGAVYPAGATVPAQFECFDNYGVASCIGTTAAGATIDMTVGTHEFTVTAVDKVGRTTARTIRYTVTGKAIDFTWTPLSIAGPRARSGHKLVYDTRRGKVVLFGGQDVSGAFLNDVWQFDPSTRVWTNVTPPAGSPAPIPRAQFGMAYDEARDKVVVYGGAVSTEYSNVGITGSTWEWDPETLTWSEKPDANTIVYVGLFGAELAYDGISKQVILFGGQPYWVYPENGETYGWNGSAWVLLTKAGPVSRIRHAMWTDAASGRVLMHGGHSIYPESRYFNDLWEWDGSRWQRLADFAGAGTEQNSPAVVFDETRGTSLLFGGAITNATKAWGPDGWALLNPNTAPSARTTAMVYASNTGEVVLFGGNTIKVPSDYTQGSFGAGAQGDTWIGRTRLRSEVSVSIAAEPAVVPYGQPATFRARLANAAGLPIANAALTFTSALGERRVAVTGPDGAALVQLNTAGLTSGLHLEFVIAEYAGDDLNVAGSAAATLTISDPTPPTIAITAPAGTYRVGTVVLAQYTCGEVESQVVECAGTVPVGAPVDTQSAGVKRFVVRATNDFGAGVEQIVSYDVVKAGTSTTLTISSPMPARFGQLLQWHAAVAAEDGTVPAGSVLFLEDGVPLTSIPLNAAGAATLLRVARPNHTIVARYAGDDTYLSSDSAAIVADVTMPSGQLRTAGANYNGVVGNGTTSPSQTLQRVAGFDDVVSVAAGALHALALRADGTVWAWGSNWAGQLGLERGDALFPVQIPGLQNIVALAAGEAYSLALRADGAVLAWGFNGSGELGSGTAFPEHNSTPRVVPGLPFISALAAGANHALALTGDGHVWGWGLTANYQLATNVFKSYGAIQLPIADVIGMAAGDHHSVALKSDGSVWTVGEGEWGQYGNGTNTAGTVFVRASIADVTAIAAGEKHTVALERDGTVWVWGHALYGQLGDGTRRQVNLPVQVSGLTDVAAIAATANANSGSRDSHNLAVKADGTLWAWGPNFYGQFGIGTTSEAVTRPVQIPVHGVTAFDAGTRFTMSVGARSETTSLQLAAADIPYGSPLTLIATLTAPTGPVAGAVVRFDARGDGTHDDATATTDAEGKAMVTLSWSTVEALGIGTVGSHSFGAQFSADASYDSSAATASFAVVKAIVPFTLIDLDQIYDGTPKTVAASGTPSGSTLEISYDGSAQPPTNAGSYAVVATLVSEQYTGTATGTLTIRKAPVTITWPAPAPIVFGTPLSNVQLNATSDVPGTFFYPFRAGIVLGGGAVTLTTTFTPADQVNYTAASASVSLQVLRATLSLGPVTASRASAETGEGVTFAVTTENVPAFAVPVIEFLADGESIGQDGSSPSRAAVTHAFAQTGAVAVTARFAGNANYLPADAPAGVEVTIAPTSRHYKIATIANGAFTNAVGINSSGMIAGTGVDPATGVLGGLVYDHGTVTPLGTIDGASLSPSVLNDQGYVAGTFVAAGVQHVFVWRDGGARDLGTPNAASSSLFVHGVNASGEVAGSFSVPTGTSSTPRAFAYLDGMMRDVSVSNSFFNVARAIFDDGTVVVNDRNVLYLRSRSGAVSAMGTPGGATADVAASRGDGTAVGIGADASGAPVAFIYRSGTFDVVGPFQQTLIPTSVSAAGNLAGVHRWGNAASFRPAALVNGTLLDLASFVPPDSGWVLNLTGGVTDRGVVVGSGTLDGQPRAFIALPREATALVAARGEGIYGGVASFEATLVAGDRAVEGRTLAFSVDGRAIGTGVTDASGTARVPGASLSDLAAGNYPLRITFAGDDDYVESEAAATLTVTKATATVRVTGGTFTYDGQPHEATVSVTGVRGETLTSGILVNYSNGDGSAGAPVQAGTFAVAAEFAGDGNYEPARGTGTIVIDPAPLRVIAKDASRKYGDANPSFEVIHEGFVNGESAAILGGTLTLGTDATPSSPAGAYAIVPGGLTASNYALTFVSGTLTVARAPLTISVADASRAYGAANPAFSATYAGFVNGEGVEALQGTLAFSTPAAASSHPGAYLISASGPASDNYAIEFVSGTLTIVKAMLPSAFATGGTFTFDGRPHAATVDLKGVFGEDLSPRVGVSYGPGGNAPVSAGSYSVAASFMGDDDYQPTTDTSARIVIVPAATSTSSIAPATAVFGEGIPVTVAVGADGSIVSPNGAVSILVDGALAGVASLVPGVAPLSGGQLVVTGLGVGSHTIAAIYPGAPNFAGSSAAALTVTVNRASTAIVLTASPEPSGAGEPVLLSANVTPIAPGAGAPGGTVEFLDNGLAIGSAAVSLVDGSYVAILTTSGLAAGLHSLTAEYAGDARFVGSSAATSHIVNSPKASTTTTLQMPGSAAAGAQVVFDAVVGAASGSTDPTGVVEFVEGSTVLGSAALQLSKGAMHAVVTTSFAAPGAHQVVARYIPDGSMSASASTPATVTIYDPAQGAPVPTSTDITAAKRVSSDEPLTVSITVTPGTPPKKTPLAGIVEIFVDNRRVAQASVSGQSASVTLTGLSIGSHEIVAVFTSDSVDYSGSTSKAAIVTVR